MGCTASNLGNEDIVHRCKERRSLLKQAVYARHHLAAAHADYLRSLLLTGSALSTFASGEPLSISGDTPPVLFRTRSCASSKPSLPPRSSLSPSSPSHSFTSRSHHSGTESSPSTSSFRTTFTAKRSHSQKSSHRWTNSTYSSTPSESSSAWDWRRFYPPSPPGSEFYRTREEERANAGNVEGRVEEVRCSEWGDSHSSIISSEEEYRGSEQAKNEHVDGDTCDGESRVENDARSSMGFSVDNTIPPSELGERVVSDEKLEVRHRDLAEIVKAIEECFVQAAAGGRGVSELLEIGRAQIDRSFRQLKKTLYHSNSVLSNLSWRWTSKPPLEIRYRLDPDTATGDSEGEKGQSHCSTLERLLAWEEKLYQEVKGREMVKIEHQKKLSLLQSQEYRGVEESKLDRTKTSIKKLQSLMVVSSEAVATISAAIVRLRDDQLSHQLFHLCYGFMDMWRLMNQLHQVQNHIVGQVRGLVNRSRASDSSTTDDHRKATLGLESAVRTWHASFSRLIKYHRDYVRSFHLWLRLNLLGVSEDDQGRPSPAAIGLSAFCDEWKQVLDRVPDAVASEGIKSFACVVHAISLRQGEEVKARRRWERTSEELEKKAAALGNIERKFYGSRHWTSGGSGGNGDHVFDTRDPLAEKRMEMEAWGKRLDDEKAKHRRAVVATRSMTVNSLQTGLPGVFYALTSFSGVMAEELQKLCERNVPSQVSI